MKIVLRLYEESVAWAKRDLTPGEQKFLIDIHNAHMVVPVMIDGIIASVEDSLNPNIGVEDYPKKWGFDGDTLIEKLRDMEPFHRFCLEIWATSFWYGSDHRDVSEPAALDEYLRGPNFTGQIEEALKKLRASIEKMGDSRHQFKSKAVAEARESAEAAYATLRQML